MTLSASLRLAQARIERNLLTDSVRLYRDRPGLADDVLDVDTGALVPPAGDASTLWEGPAAVLNDREDGKFRVLLPLAAPALEGGDLVLVLTSARDAQLVGKKSRVVGRPKGGTYAVVRELETEVM